MNYITRWNLFNSHRRKRRT